ncbi:type II secretion system F family protein [Shewanella sp. YLB-07]|uniref:type II secretion system F family protein n=1 Tax=Shewanella sp. YLB-07 TaxID=2601268 RepID=UPI001883E2EF|nr:type II secretion system F family protein [Shewanella sp. YLB-07]
MMTLSLWVSFMLLLAGGSLALLSSVKARQRDGVVARLQLVERGAMAFAKPQNQLQSKIKVSDDIKALLLRAGFYSEHAASIFVVAKLLVAISCFIGWMAYSGFSFDKVILAKGVVFAVIGGIGVEHWVKFRARLVSSRIAGATPDALDLMVVCVESGLTLEAVFGRVGQEMVNFSPELSREWLITEAELRLLDSRPQALKNLALRTGIIEIENMVIALSQAEKYGSPIAKSMRLIASDSRQHQYLALEEKVGKIPAKMSMPLVVLVMIPVVVLIVAPTIIELMTSIGEL